MMTVSFIEWWSRKTIVIFSFMIEIIWNIRSIYNLWCFTLSNCFCLYNYNQKYLLKLLKPGARETILCLPYFSCNCSSIWCCFYWISCKTDDCWRNFPNVYFYVRRVWNVEQNNIAFSLSFSTVVFIFGVTMLNFVEVTIETMFFSKQFRIQALFFQTYFGHMMSACLNYSYKLIRVKN